MRIKIIVSTAVLFFIAGVCFAGGHEKPKDEILETPQNIPAKINSTEDTSLPGKLINQEFIFNPCPVTHKFKN
ncbi:MAG: hypothetical protein WKF35_03255 [Ferruginibacter sp.]